LGNRVTIEGGVLMDFLGLVTNLISRIPIERVLFPPRDEAKSLEKFATTISAPESSKTETSEQEMVGSTVGNPTQLPPDLAPLPTDPQTAGKAIAEELGLRFDGVQPGIGMQFTDVAQTGSTFYANTLAEAKARLEVMRAEFQAAKTPPLKDEVATACIPCAL